MLFELLANSPGNNKDVDFSKKMYKFFNNNNLSKSGMKNTRTIANLLLGNCYWDQKNRDKHSRE